MICVGIPCQKMRDSPFIHSRTTAFILTLGIQEGGDTSLYRPLSPSLLTVASRDDSASNRPEVATPVTPDCVPVRVLMRLWYRTFQSWTLQQEQYKH